MANEPPLDPLSLVNGLQQQLDEFRLEQAVDLAKHDAEMAQRQAERSVPTTLGFLIAVVGIGAAGGFLTPFMLANPIHLLGGLALGAFALLYAVSFAYVVHTLRPVVEDNPTPESPGRLALLAIPRGERALHYLKRATYAVQTYTDEAAAIGAVAHGRHRRNKRASTLVTAALVVGMIAFTLLVRGV